MLTHNQFKQKRQQCGHCSMFVPITFIVRHWKNNHPHCMNDKIFSYFLKEGQIPKHPFCKNWIEVNEESLKKMIEPNDF